MKKEKISLALSHTATLTCVTFSDLSLLKMFIAICGEKESKKKNDPFGFESNQISYLMYVDRMDAVMVLLILRLTR